MQQKRLDNSITSLQMNELLLRERILLSVSNSTYNLVQSVLSELKGCPLNKLIVLNDLIEQTLEYVELS